MLPVQSKVNFYLFRDSHSEYSGYFLTTFKPKRDTTDNWSFCIGGRNTESVILLGVNQLAPILEKFGLKQLQPGFGLDLMDGSLFNVKEVEKAAIYD